MSKDKGLIREMGVGIDTFEYGNGYKCQLAIFDSVAHMVECVENGYGKFGWNNNNVASQFDGLNGRLTSSSMDWVFGEEFDSLKKTIDALTNGYSSARTLQKIEEYYEQIMKHEFVSTMLQKNKSVKRKRIFTDGGSELSIDRLLSGDENHWQQMTKGAKNNVVKIAIQSVLSGYNSESQFNEIVAMLAVACDLLNKVGYSVEIYSFGTTCRATSKFETAGWLIPIKKATETLDIQRLSSIGIPGFMRAFWFNVIANIIEGGRGGGSSFGRCHEVPVAVYERYDINHCIEQSWSGGRTREVYNGNF